MDCLRQLYTNSFDLAVRLDRSAGVQLWDYRIANMQIAIQWQMYDGKRGKKNGKTKQNKQTSKGDRKSPQTHVMMLMRWMCFRIETQSAINDLLDNDGDKS